VLSLRPREVCRSDAGAYLLLRADSDPALRVEEMELGAVDDEVDLVAAGDLGIRTHPGDEIRRITERGHVLITGFELSTRFPFGFFRFRRRLRARDVDIVVYPKPEPVGDELHLLPAYAGRMASLRRGIGQDLFSLRNYQPKDDLRHIDWKATARSRNLTVREFTAEDERRITIVLDTRDLVDSDEQSFSQRFERGVIQAASLLKHFIDERAEVRLMLGNELGPYGSGLKHLYQCLRRLAVVSPQKQGGEEQLSKSVLDPRNVNDDTVFDEDYAIVLTTVSPGSIPAKIWRASHIIHL